VELVGGVGWGGGEPVGMLGVLPDVRG